MILSPAKLSTTDSAELTASLLRIIGLLLEGYALHAVEFDAEEHRAFREAVRGIEKRFGETEDVRDLLILAGEANKTIQSYGQSLEKYIRLLSKEKQLAIDLLAESLLRVCNSSEESAQAMREIENNLKNASQLEDMRQLRGKLAGAVDVLCKEAERQEQQYRNLQQRLAETTVRAIGADDPVTGLPTMTQVGPRIDEARASGQQAYALAFFLKNLDGVNRRFGYAAGDRVLRQFVAYLGKHFKSKDELFRWRGPCFVVIAERRGSIEIVKAEAHKVATHGPEHEVEGQGRSMLFRLTAASAVFPISRTGDTADLSARIDRFAAEQFRDPPSAR